MQADSGHLKEGKVIESNLRALGLNDKWLNKRLSESKIKQCDIFLMTVDDEGVINLILKDEKNK